MPRSSIHKPERWTAEEEWLSLERKLKTGDIIIRDGAGKFVTRLSNRRHASLIVVAPELLQALKDLAGSIDLGKLNVRKDFSMMNAHAAALKAIHKAERRLVSK